MGLPRVMCCSLHMGGRPRHALCEEGMTAACQLFNYLMGLLGPISAQMGKRRAMCCVVTAQERPAAARHLLKRDDHSVSIV